MPPTASPQRQISGLAATTSRLRSSTPRRTFLLLVVCFLAISSLPTHIGAITLELSSSDIDYVCTSWDGPTVVTIYVRISFNSGIIASRFRVQASPEVTWSYLSETPSSSTFLGNTQTGITICYDPCLVEQAVLVSIQYMTYGTSSECSGGVVIAPHPDAETVEVINCDGSPRAAFTRPLAVGLICSCPSPVLYPGTATMFDCAPLATRVTTWGSVKALYRAGD